MECYLATERHTYNVLIPTMVDKSFQNIMLSERSQFHRKATYRIVLLTGNVQHRRIHWEQTRLVTATAQERGVGVTANGYGLFS